MRSYHSSEKEQPNEELFNDKKSSDSDNERRMKEYELEFDQENDSFVNEAIAKWKKRAKERTMLDDDSRSVDANDKDKSGKKNVKISE